ncbi:hypothetical protein QQ045_016042 [Rhodiola kirilowii]
MHSLCRIEMTLRYSKRSHQVYMHIVSALFISSYGSSIDLSIVNKSFNSNFIKTLVQILRYHTAQNCRRCRNDKLESSSYWIAQIKLAESVGKHFASIMFFQLAHKCNAEPARSLKIELKRYMSQHGHLARQKEWIEASRNHGLPVPKDDHNCSGEREDSKDQSNSEDD